jgi:hypothetical protein
MKVLLATLATLAMATTASASHDVITQKKIEEFSDDYAPVMYWGFACRNENQYELSEQLHRYAYTQWGGLTSGELGDWHEKTVVDIYMSGAEYRMDYEIWETIWHAKRNRNDPYVKAACKEWAKLGDSIISKIKEVLD